MLWGLAVLPFRAVLPFLFHSVRVTGLWTETFISLSGIDSTSRFTTALQPNPTLTPLSSYEIWSSNYDWPNAVCETVGGQAGLQGGWTDEQTDRQTDTGLLALNWIIWTSPEFPSSNPDQIGTQLLPYRPPAVCATVSNWYTQTRTKGRHTQYPISCLMSTLSSFAVKLLHLSEQI